MYLLYLLSYCERKPADSRNSEPHVPNVTVLKFMAERKMQANMITAKRMYTGSC